MKVSEVLSALGCPPARADYWAPHVASACNEFDIDTPQRVACFVAQVGHESAVFQCLEENLNYSAKALLAVFGKYFKTQDQADKFARRPMDIANRVYANRMGNRDESSGDGYLYRGRGLIQLTGRTNYRECGAALGLDLEANPAILAEDPRAAARSAAWFWKGHGLNELAGKGDFEGITRRINGGLNGQEHRLELLAKAKEALGI